jgi:hypothetical protein
MSAMGLGCVKTLTCHSFEQFYILQAQADRKFPGAGA